jgi:hypothetical protein
MKHSKTFLGFLVLLCAAALFLGCPTDSDDDDGDGGGVKILKITVTADDGVKYFSLGSGIEVKGAAKIASRNWDIAFQRSRQIFTNSGATAEAFKSGGNGGVWFAADTDGSELKAFSQVNVDDAVSPSGSFVEYADFTEDIGKYVAGMSVPTLYRLNIMTYLGYPSGDGSNGTGSQYGTISMGGGPSPSYVPYNYDKRQFYRMLSMTGGTFELTNQVYIIKHGDGVHYSKLEVTDYESRSADAVADPPVLAADVYEITYQNF